jgi:hypothetical protein
MSKRVRIKTGVKDIVLPDGNTYQGGNIVTLTDDQYADLAPTAIGDEVLDIEGMVTIGSENNDLRYFHIPISLAGVVDGDLDATEFTPGFAGTIKAVRFITDTVSTGAGATTVLSLEINEVAVTGGAVTVTLAGSDTKAEVTAGTAVTAANVFDDNDTITVHAATTTAFTAGDGILEVLVVAS